MCWFFPKKNLAQVQNNLTEQRVNQLEEAQWSYAINVDGTGSGDRIYWSMGKIYRIFGAGVHMIWWPW